MDVAIEKYLCSQIEFRVKIESDFDAITTKLVGILTP